MKLELYKLQGNLHNVRYNCLCNTSYKEYSNFKL